MLHVRTRTALPAVIGLLVLLVALAGTLAGPDSRAEGSDPEPAAGRYAPRFLDGAVDETLPGAAATMTEAQRAARPNIVLISADDMTVTDLRWMPVVRKLLIQQGVSFERALSPHPLCCPARAAILTGQYAQNNGVKGNQTPYNFVALKNKTTLPVWLRNAGYRTAFTGKYLNGFGTQGARQPGWDYWDPTMIGQYAYTPFQMYNNGDRTWYRGINNVDYINARVTNLVERWAPQRRPFFIWASQVAPHGRLDRAQGIESTAKAFPPRRYARAFAGVDSPSLSDPAFDESDVSDKNSLVQSKNPPPAQLINEIFRSRIRSLQAVDDGVRQLVTTLREQGELDNTYIMFTSDNGFLLGEHRLVTKNVPYRQSVRVPLVVRGPGVPTNVKRQQRALMVDLAPTIADIAGAQPMVKVDGVSLLPTLRTDRPLRDTVLIQAGPSKQTDDGGKGWFWRGVVTRRYTYAAFYGDGIEELYDRDLDPAEVTNVATSDRYENVLAEMRRRAAALLDCAGASECSRDFGPEPRPGSGPIIPLPPLPVSSRS